MQAMFITGSKLQKSFRVALKIRLDDNSVNFVLEKQQCY